MSTNVTAIDKYWQAVLPRMAPGAQGMGLHPRSAVWIAEQVVAWKPKTLLELGAGFSTLVLADACAEAGTELWSYDHDEKWLERVREKLGAAVAAGLIRKPTFRTINRTNLEKLFGKRQEGLQMMLVDHGPTTDRRLADMKDLARMLDSGGVMVLDDCRRTTRYEKEAAKLLAQCGLQLRTADKAKAHSNRWLSYAVAP